jgi:ArsR family transcriptional regulator
VYTLKADFFRVLGHPVRVRVLQLLRGGELSVRALQEALEIDSSVTSQHLAALRKQGFVTSRREGTSVYTESPTRGRSSCWSSRSRSSPRRLSTT